jgi:hypothetical protein
MIMRRAALLTLAFMWAACSSRPTPMADAARVRNQPPVSCTQDDFNRCPPLASQVCESGAEAVIDYSADCCPHFSCQPLCVSPLPCPLNPAPTCPPGTQLWIGTGLEDCCPAYRCEPDSLCDPTSTDFANTEAQARGGCAAALPYCGAGVQPAYIGDGADCCPIYQCPCDMGPGVPGQMNGDGTDPSTGTPKNEGYCGCTYPVCRTQEEMVCTSTGGPCPTCTCALAQANCVTDADCPPDWRCDSAGALSPPPCDPTGAEPCSGAAQGGVCVAPVVAGCSADTECPSGQRCDVACGSWDAVGTCQAYYGQCMPLMTCIEPAAAADCPAPPSMPCADPVQTLDPTTCCPIYQCPGQCMVDAGAPCPLAQCYCGVQVGLDANCCPLMACPPVTPPAACPALCGPGGACDAGQSCVDGFCL